MFHDKQVGKEYFEPVLAALLAAGLVCVLYLLRGFYPFGNGSIAMTDLYSQYLPLLYRFYDVVTGKKNLFTDLHLAGGVNLYIDTINEVLNPFNYFLLLSGRSRIYQSVNILLGIYISSAAASADWAFRKLVLPGPAAGSTDMAADSRENVGYKGISGGTLRILLATGYAMSGYTACCYQIIKWMIFPVLFPLFILSVFRMLNKGKSRLYSVLTAYQMILSIQLGFMSLLFVLFGTGLYFRVCAGDREKRTAMIRRTGFATLTGMMVSGAVLVPNIFLLTGSARSGELFSYIDLICQTGLRDIADRIFYVFQPIATAAVIYYGIYWIFLKRRLLSGETGGRAHLRFLVLWNLFLWITVLLQPANLLWHMGSYMCFPVRYAYMVIFAGCCLALVLQKECKISASAAMLQRRNAAQNTGRASCSIPGFLKGMAAVCLCCVSVFLTLHYETRITQAFSSLLLTACKAETAIVFLILLLLLLSAILSMQSRVLLTVTTAVCSVCAFLFVFLPEDYQIRKDNESAYEAMNAQYMEGTDAEDMNFSAGEAAQGIRYADMAETEDSEALSLPRNAALVNHTYTLTSYLPTLSAKTQSLFAYYDYEVYWVATSAKGGSGISREMLSYAHLADREDLASAHDPADLLSCRAGMELDHWKGTIRVKTAAAAGETLQVPFTNIAGWHCLRNGTNAEIRDIAGGLISVEMEEGENEVLLYFVPPGIAAGAVMSLLGILLLVLYPVWPVVGAAGLVMQILYRMLLLAAIAAVYLVPGCGAAWNAASRLSGRVPPVKQTIERMLPAVFTGTEGDASAEMPLILTESGEEGIQVQIYPGNLMRRKGVRITADSSEKKELGPAFAGDGIADSGDSRWSSVNDRDSCDHWLSVSFGDDVQPFLVRIYWERCNASQYALEWSEDGTAWNTLCSFDTPPEENVQDVLLDASAGIRDMPDAVRFLRLHVTDVLRNEEDLTLYYQNVSVLEMEVYERPEQEFLVEIPEITDEEGRILQMPEVPDGFRLEWVGADYGMLIGEDRRIADTIADVPVELGFALLSETWRTELPAMDAVIPACSSILHTVRDSRDGNTGTVSAAEGSPALAGAELFGADEPAEWFPLDVYAGLDGNFLIFTEENATELLCDMADLLAAELTDPGYGFTGRVADEAEITAAAVPGKDPGPAVIVLSMTGEDDTESSFPVSAVSGGEGYNIDLLSDGRTIRIYGNTEQGVRWGCVFLKNLIFSSAERSAGVQDDGEAANLLLPAGYLRDYPKWDVRGFGIDTGRRQIPLDMLYNIVRELSDHQMNTFHIHLNDNEIISQISGFDGSMESAREGYAAYRLESEITGRNGQKITSEDLSYTRDEFRKLIRDAKVYGVEIVPEIDMPAHSLAFTKAFPDLGFSDNPEGADELDLGNQEAFDFAQRIWGEYLETQGDGETQAVFSDCGVIHLGMDEYFGKGEDYIRFLKSLSEYAAKTAPEKTQRIWGSFSYIGADFSDVSRNIELQIWSPLWADPVKMYEEGFPIINSLSGSLYIIPGGGYDRLDTEFLKDTWEPNVFETRERIWEIPAYSPRALGAVYMMWNDHAGKTEAAISDASLMERFREPLDILTDKLW